MSADSNKTCNAFRTLAHEHLCLNISEPIFQSIDLSVTNFQLIMIVDSFQSTQKLVNFSSANAFSITNLYSVSEGAQRVSLIQQFISSTIYSKLFKLIDVSVPNKYESNCASRMVAHAKCLISNKLSCAFQLVVRTKPLKANSAKLNETPMSQQSTLLYFNGGSSRLIGKYIYSSNSEGARSTPTTLLITQALDCQRLLLCPSITKYHSIFAMIKYYFVRENGR